MNDGLAKFKVPAMNAVGYWVFLKQWNEILIDPGNVFWAVADKKLIFQHLIIEPIYKQKENNDPRTYSAVKVSI